MLISVQKTSPRASDRGRIGVFYAFKTPKNALEMIGDFTYVFKQILFLKMTRFILIMQEYDSKCLEMYLITIKVVKKCLRRSPKSMKGSQIHRPYPNTLEVTYSSVEKLSKALFSD
jgi:hypothetical protein